MEHLLCDFGQRSVGGTELGLLEAMAVRWPEPNPDSTGVMGRPLPSP